jgi:hypothetical protein
MNILIGADMTSNEMRQVLGVLFAKVGKDYKGKKLQHAEGKNTKLFFCSDAMEETRKI